MRLVITLDLDCFISENLKVLNNRGGCVTRLCGFFVALEFQ
jgi:hypothetical protein